MRYLMAVLVLLLPITVALAQSTAKPKSREEMMQQTLQIALANIQSARCANGERCKPATEEEKKNPPLSLTETSQIVGRGVFSGGAAYCGLDWNKRNFEPMMAYWRKVKMLNDRQLALVSIIHGMVQEQITRVFTSKGPCPPEIKKDLESKLDFKP